MIDGLHQSGSLRLMFPRNDGTDLAAVMINCAGGMTGGDRFGIAAEAGANTALTLTTQTAERLYKSNGPEPARLRTRLQVRDRAALCWLPQETILFDGCALHRRLNVDLAPDARFFMIEPLVFGRSAMGEVLNDAHFDDQIRIYRDGQLIHADATLLSGDASAQLSRPAVANNAQATATLALAGPDAEAALGPARDIIGPHGGASLKAPDLLVMRLLTADARDMRRIAMALIAALSGVPTPRTWTL